MDEYISRETMRGIIREQEAKHGLMGCAWIEMAMDRQTAADVVPVVRCGECVHQYRQDYGPLAGARFCNVWCMINGMGDDGFCNYGEPKEGV